VAQAQVAVRAELHAGEQVLEALGGDGGVDDAPEGAVGVVAAARKDHHPVSARVTGDWPGHDQAPPVGACLAEVVALGHVERLGRLGAVAVAHEAFGVGGAQRFDVWQQGAAALQEFLQHCGVAGVGHLLAPEAQQGRAQQQVDLVELAFERLPQRLSGVGGRSAGAVELRAPAVDERHRRQRGDQCDRQHIGPNEAADQPRWGRGVGAGLSGRLGAQGESAPEGRRVHCSW
jgi:hypothetical protein